MTFVEIEVKIAVGVAVVLVLDVKLNVEVDESVFVAQTVTDLLAITVLLLEMVPLRVTSTVRVKDDSVERVAEREGLLVPVIETLIVRDTVLQTDTDAEELIDVELLPLFEAHALAEPDMDFDATVLKELEIEPDELRDARGEVVIDALRDGDDESLGVLEARVEREGDKQPLFVREAQTEFVGERLVVAHREGESVALAQ